MKFENTTERNAFHHPRTIEATCRFSGTYVRYDVHYINFCCILDYLRHCASTIKADVYPEEDSSLFLRNVDFHVPDPKHVAITYKTTKRISHRRENHKPVQAYFIFNFNSVVNNSIPSSLLKITADINNIIKICSK